MGIEVDGQSVFPFVPENVVGARCQPEMLREPVGELEAGKCRGVVSGKSGCEADGFLTFN